MGHPLDSKTVRFCQEKCSILVVLIYETGIFENFKIAKIFIHFFQKKRDRLKMRRHADRSSGIMTVRSMRRRIRYGRRFGIFII